MARGHLPGLGRPIWPCQSSPTSANRQRRDTAHAPELATPPPCSSASPGHRLDAANASSVSPRSTRHLTLPPALSLAPSTPWPTQPRPRRRETRSHRRPLVASPCQEAPLSSTASPRPIPERSLAPEMLHRARPQLRPPEIPFAAPAASTHPRPLRLPRRDPRELSHLPTLSVLSLEPRSDRT